MAQEFNLSFLNIHAVILTEEGVPLPVKYHSLVAEGQPRIRDIVVTEIKSTSEQSQLN